MADIETSDGLESGDEPRGAESDRRAYETPRLVSGDIFERVLMSSHVAPAPFNPACA